MKIRFLTPARDELREALIHLEDQRDGLGQQFLEEVRATTARIEQFPLAWMSLSENTRSCRTNRFKYRLIYHVGNDEIVIVAVSHMHREPGYWRDRKHKM